MRILHLGFCFLLVTALVIDATEALGLSSLVPSALKKDETKSNDNADKSKEDNNSKSSSDKADDESRYSIGNILNSAKDVTTGVVQDVGKLLPTPDGFFDSGKQLLAGYPFAFVSSTINKFCSSAISSQAIQPKYTPEISKMKFQLRTLCNREHFPLLEADKLLKSPNFDPKKKIVILASGWTTNVNDTAIIDTIGKAYLCRGDTNFIAVDAASFVDTLYSWSAFNTEEIGMHLSEGLKLMAEVVPLEKIHLIGHSLGAHIVGAAGRYFYYKTGKVIPRITGLDPAKPCFNEGENLSGLSRGDADFIDVIHSNSGVLGKSEPTGDADFYPGGIVPLTPGCFDIFCAHARAWEYYAETVYPGNEKNFMGKRCGSLTKLREDKCPGQSFPMGYGIPHNLKGNYFLEVRSESPFGEGSDRQRALMHENCGACEKDKKKQ